MKVKFLSLFLAFGIFAMGTSVMAKEEAVPSAPGDEKALAKFEAQAQGVDPIAAACKLVTLYDTKCVKCTNITELKDCLAVIANDPKTLSNVCYYACSATICKSDALQNLCMNACCPANKSNIGNCLKQNGVKKCS